MIGIYGCGLVCSILYIWKKGRYRKHAVIAGVGALAALILWIMQYAGDKDRLTQIARGEKGEGARTVYVTAETGKESTGFELEILPQAYEKEELSALCEEMWNTLEKEIPAQNDSLAHVTRELYFPQKVAGYPFSLSWRTNRWEILSATGKVGDEVPGEGKLVLVEVSISAEGYDYEEIRTFAVRVFPAKDAESFWRRLQKRMKEEENRDEKTYLLPQAFEGRKLTFYEQKKDKSFGIFLLTVAGAAAAAAGEREKEKQKEKKRLEALAGEYPQVVMRLAMLVEAGFGVSAAVRRIAGDYGKRKQEQKLPLYEELLIVCREIDSGISEKEAYQNMGERCALPCIIRFTALLNQYARSGAGGLKMALLEESRQALSERREQAKRAGEEAGTKLLLPMTLLLVLVMALIMIPAFTSFGA